MWSLDPPQVTRDAIAAVEQDGIVFIDEIDKIVSSAETRLGAEHCRSLRACDYSPVSHKFWSEW